MSEIVKHNYYQFGPYLAEFRNIDKAFCDKLLKLGQQSKIPHNQHLAGKIKKERLLPNEEWITKGFSPYVHSYMTGYNVWSKHTQHPAWFLKSCWINFQKQFEFNPPHIHTNCDLSFVLWLKVPQIILKEHHKDISTGHKSGCTVFKYGDDITFTSNEKVFFPIERTFIIFPARLQHYVVPHKSKATRVSVAGNIKFDGI